MLQIYSVNVSLHNLCDSSTNSSFIIKKIRRRRIYIVLKDNSSFPIIEAYIIDKNNKFGGLSFCEYNSLTMRTITIVGALLCTIFVLPAQVQIDTNHLHLDTLDNGLRVAIYTDTTSELSALSLAFHAGSKYDRADQSGMAYLAHRLMINGEVSDYSNRGAEEILNYLTGGTISRHFSKDYSIFNQVFRAEELEQALDIESSRLKSGNFTTAKINNQRKIIAETSDATITNLSIDHIIEKKLYQGHPYEQLLKGSSDLVDGTTNGEVRNFVRRHYAANRAILVITSPTVVDTVITKVEQYFSRWPQGSYNETSFSFKSDSVDSISIDTIRSVSVTLPIGIIAYPIPISRDTGYTDFFEMAECLMGFQTFFLDNDSSLSKKLGFLQPKLEQNKDINICLIQFAPKINQKLNDSLFAAIDTVYLQYMDTLITEESWQRCCNQQKKATLLKDYNAKSYTATIMENMLETNKPWNSPSVSLDRRRLKQFFKQYFRPEQGHRFMIIPDSPE